MNTSHIVLQDGSYCLLDTEDFIEIVKLNITWNANIDRRSGKTNRVQGWYKGQTMGIHTLIMQPPVNMEIDHINRNALDNRKINLRLASHSQNGFNRGNKSPAKSGFRGVYKNRLRFMAIATTKQTGRVYLGLFKSAEEAAEVRDRFIIEQGYGEFAVLNFPEMFKHMKDKGK